MAEELKRVGYPDEMWMDADVYEDSKKWSEMYEIIGRDITTDRVHLRRKGSPNAKVRNRIAKGEANSTS